MELDKLIDLILNNLSSARQNELDEKMYAPCAAACLEAQLKLASIVANDEFEARQAKAELECVLGERAVSIRENSAERITDATMTALLSKDSKVKTAKQVYADKERESKKYGLINATLSNAHIFFRGLDKTNKGF